MPDRNLPAIERAFRESSGRAVATLVRLFGDIDLAEEAVQEAFGSPSHASTSERKRVRAPIVSAITASTLLK